MQTKFTPGPWIQREGSGVDIEITSQKRLDESKVEICSMDTDYNGQIGIEQEANARLIAAAPELLAALQAIAEGNVMEPVKEKWTHADAVLEYQKLAAAAIAKAS